MGRRRHGHKKDFAPRLGVAYRLNEKTVIRGGYGISVDPDNMRNQRNQYPSIVNQVYQPLNTYQFISYAGVPNSDGVAQVSLADGIPMPTFPNISVGHHQTVADRLADHLSAEHQHGHLPGELRPGILPDLELLRPARILAHPGGAGGVCGHAWRPHRWASTSTGRLRTRATPGASSIPTSPAT